MKTTNIIYFVALLAVICYASTSKPSKRKQMSSGGEGETALTVAAKRSHVRVSFKTAKFGEAIRKRNMETAKKIFDRGNERQKESYGAYLIALGGDELVNLVQRVNDDDAEWSLRVVAMYADKELVKDILQRAKPSATVLCDVAMNVELVCKPTNFIHFLEGISERDDQKEALRCGVDELFYKDKTGCLNPLLSALHAASLDQEVRDGAVEQAFLCAFLYPDGDRASYGRVYCDHPAISAKDYSDALYSSYKRGGRDPKNELFLWLLASADYIDLETVKKDEDFSDELDEFQETILKALDAAKKHGRRRNVEPVENVREAAKTLWESTNGSIAPKGVGGIIAEYLLGEGAMQEIQEAEKVKETAPMLGAEVIGNLASEFEEELWKEKEGVEERRESQGVGETSSMWSSMDDIDLNFGEITQMEEVD